MFTIIVGNFNTSLSTIARTTRQKVSKNIEELNTTIILQDITIIYKTFHPLTVGYKLFSSAYGIYSKIEHILGHKIKPH